MIIMWSPERVEAVRQVADLPMVPQTVAAAALGCSRTTVHRMLADGRLTAYRPISGHREVVSNDVIRLVRDDVEACETAGVRVPDNLPFAVLPQRPATSAPSWSR